VVGDCVGTRPTNLTKEEPPEPGLALEYCFLFVVDIKKIQLISTP
jgi:hypothetical protein